MTALIAAGSAIGGGALTGVFTLDVARRTLTDQTLANQRAVRRAAYVTYLSRTDSAYQTLVAWQSAIGTGDEVRRRREYDAAVGALAEALNVVRLEGPDAVATAAENLRDALAADTPGTRHAVAQEAFLTAARAALTPARPLATG